MTTKDKLCMPLKTEKIGVDVVLVSREAGCNIIFVKKEFV